MAAAAAACLSVKRVSSSKRQDDVMILECSESWHLTMKSLPKLPVPDLKETLETYLRCLRSIVSEEPYTKTRKLVEEFGRKGGLGEELQIRLKEYAETRDNWSHKFSLDEVYLHYRRLPVLCSSMITLSRQNFNDQMDQIRFAARLLYPILDYKIRIDLGLLLVDRASSHTKGQPLCMEQYTNLFNSYRFPGVRMDSLVKFSIDKNKKTTKHVIVACRNQFFVLDVMSDGVRLDEDELFDQLNRCVQTAIEDELAAEPAVGILTCAPRDSWAVIRQRLLQDPENRSNLEALEHCICVICLDKAMPLIPNEHENADTAKRIRLDDSKQALQVLHGNGSRHSTCNRWFDKTLQLVISEDGAFGVCMEHSAAEGIVVLQFMEHLFRYIKIKEKNEMNGDLQLRQFPKTHLVHQRKLKWNLPSDVKIQMAEVAEPLDRLIEDVHMSVLRFMDYGSDFQKSQNLSPDAYMQMVIQLTYYRLYGRLATSVESASIRRFRLGRVDYVRASTAEALEWCQAMTSTAEAGVKNHLFRKAIERQVEYAVEAISGRGIENHLIGLRQIAREYKRVDPELFQDDSYEVFNHIIVGTSQVPASIDTIAGYGPYEHDGYGVCYCPQSDYILVCISSFKSYQGTDSDLFADNLESSLRLVKELCQSVNNTLRSVL